jgi:hypothetical protein
MLKRMPNFQMMGDFFSFFSQERQTMGAQVSEGLDTSGNEMAFRLIVMF